MIDQKSSINNFLNEVNMKVRLSDFIGQYVDLVEKGNSFVGRCPFHNEKTPSFNVNNEKSLFYCFGCKAGGNILNFTTKYKNFTFLEAVDYVSKYAGISFIVDKKTRKVSSHEKIILEILKKANNFFQSNLQDSSEALNYLRSRGLKNEEIKTFNIGFCPEEKLLINYLKEKGFELEDIKKTDLLIKNKNDEFFGRFRKRITFPIFDFSNNLVGFGGRSMIESKIKYINSQESLVFKKSQMLFGLQQNLEFIRKEKQLFLVEGYMDVIKLYSYGIKNAVSPLGTTLSEIQLRKMWNYSEVPFICFDGDDAGISASKKIAVKILKFLKPGKSLKFITIPENADPDLFLENKTKTDFLNLRNQSIDLSNLIWEIVRESIKTDTPEFLAIIDEKIKNIIDKIEDRNVSSEYFKFLKAKKDSYIWNINKIQSGSYKLKGIVNVIENINEKLFISMILLDKNYITEFHEEIFDVRLVEVNLREELQKILKIFNENPNSTLLNIEKFKETNLKFYQEILDLKRTHLDSLVGDEKKIFFKQILNNLRLPVLINERELIQKEIVEEKNSLISENLLKKYTRISEEIRVIQNKDIE